METEIEIRNKKIQKLRKEIAAIYEAAIPLIEHAKTSYDGRKALWKWDDIRPSTYMGERK